MSSRTLRHGHPAEGKIRRAIVLLALLSCCATSAGCASLTNPVVNGVPVRLLPPELLAESKRNYEALPLSYLRQTPPVAYIVEAEDVLGVWIDGVLGEKGQSPPLQVVEGKRTGPALGLPIPVRADGTIHLPFIEPLKVQGLTLSEIEEAIRKAYTVTKQIIQPGRERIFVSLYQPRQYHILVIRQDSIDNNPSNALNQGGGVGFFVGISGGDQVGVSRGRGFAIDLPAYENDVLNALARTGGFPGPEAVNAIIVERGSTKVPGRSAGPLDLRDASAPGGEVTTTAGTQIFRIPLRVRVGERPTFPPEAVILRSGDTVYIESRQNEVYYTNGLLSPARYILPRDVDLDVVEAITRAGGAINSGGVSASNVSGTALTGSAIGGPSPSLVTVLRRMPNGKQVTIRVDLNQAMRDPRERLLIQAQDVVMLQQTPLEAITRYASAVFRLNFAYTLIDSSRASALTTTQVP